MPFEIGGTYIYNPDLQFVVGVSIDVERKYPVIPGGGIRWKFQPHWVLNAVLPTPRLEFEWNKNLTLYAGATLKETNFRMSDDFGREHGIPKLDHAVLTYSEVRAGGGIDWKVTSWFSVNAEAGYQPYRNFDFYRANIRFHEDGSAPYGMIALTARSGRCRGESSQDSDAIREAKFFRSAARAFYCAPCPTGTRPKSEVVARLGQRELTRIACRARAECSRNPISVYNNRRL